MLEADTVVGRGVSRHQDRELMLDIGQLVLDVVGIFDPTPASDGANVLISLARGDLFGAGISAISIVPFVGDLAKVGKLGKWAQTVEAAVERMNDAHLAPVVRPYLEKISDLMEAAPQAAWNRLPTDVRNSLEELKGKIDSALGRTVASVSRNYGENHVTWLRDENGNTIRASAVLREVFPKDSHPRSNAESALTTAIGHTGQPSDVGGHIIGHQFLGRDSGDFNIVPQHGTVITPPDSPNLNQYGNYAA